MNRRDFLSDGLALAAGVPIAGAAMNLANSDPAVHSGGSGMVAVMAELLFEAGDSERAATALAKLAAATRLEPGCLRYAVSKDLAEPGRFHLSEVWMDLASLADHFSTAHMAAFSADARALGYSAPYLKQISVSAFADFRPSELKRRGKSNSGSNRK